MYDVPQALLNSQVIRPIPDSSFPITCPILRIGPSQAGFLSFTVSAMNFLACLSAGFVSPPALLAGDRRWHSGNRGVAMMPNNVPQVPYKYPGMESPQWISVYNRMYRERIMFLGQDIDDDYANMMIAVLLYLESEDANSPASMYFNVAGGVTKAGLAMYDTMRIMPYDIQTVNMGIAAEVAAFLVAGGTPGKRFALPNARFMLQADLASW